MLWDATQRDIPEDLNPRLYHCENLQTRTVHLYVEATLWRFWDPKTLSVGLEPLQIKATRSFETSGTTYPAAATHRHMPALKTSKNRKFHAAIQKHQC